MNVTYLIGAGASVQAVPVAKSLAKGISSFIEKLEEGNYKLDDRDNKSRNDFILQAREIINEVVQKQITIDSYASGLVASNGLGLNMIKTLLSCYLIYEQLNSPYDSRYTDFFKKLLMLNGNKLPYNVKVISWNYDSQFELAYSDLVMQKDINKVISELNAYYYLSDSLDMGKFGIVRLNGVGSFFATDTNYNNLAYHTFPYGTGFSTGVLKTLLNVYEKCQMEDLLPSIQFAWEKTELSKLNVSKAFQVAHETEILVVIGYSFPSFNKPIDMSIIDTMKNLQRIYLQVHPDDYRNVHQNLSGYLRFLNFNAEIERVENLTEFWQPVELSSI